MTENVPAVVPDNPKSVQVAMDVRGLAPRTMDELARFALAVSRSGLAPKGMDRPESIMVVVQTGMEAGLSPMAALRALYIVPGAQKPGWYVEAALGLVRKSGKATTLDFGVRGDGEKMEGYCRTKRSDMSEAVERTFTVSDAKRAGLWGKGNWSSYPQRMLQHRAVGWIMHDFYSDVLMGLSLDVEIVDNIEGSARVERDVTPPTQPDPLLAIAPPAAPEEEVDPATGEVIPPWVGNSEQEVA